MSDFDRYFWNLKSCLNQASGIVEKERKDFLGYPKVSRMLCFLPLRHGLALRKLTLKLHHEVTYKCFLCLMTRTHCSHLFPVHSPVVQGTLSLWATVSVQLNNHIFRLAVCQTDTEIVFLGKTERLVEDQNFCTKGIYRPVRQIRPGCGQLWCEQLRLRSRERKRPSGWRCVSVGGTGLEAILWFWVIQKAFEFLIWWFEAVTVRQITSMF